MTGAFLRSFSRVVLVASTLTPACGESEPKPPSATTPAPAVESGLEAQPTPSEQATQLLAESYALQAAGEIASALARAEEAISAGGGRDARVQAASLAILITSYDRAVELLGPVVEANPQDAIAQYDLGLAHHRRDDYNRARTAYLAALRAEPTHAEARHNLAVLCWNKGVLDEARHHVEKFQSAHPDDPRAKQLLTMVESGKQAP